MRIHSLLTVLLLPLLLACTQDTQQDITLSPSAAELYRLYSELPGDKAFAVTRDGRYSGFGYCRNLDCRGNYGSVALQSCLEARGRARLRKADQTDCVILAVGDRVVWEGAVTVAEPGGTLRFRFNPADGTAPLGPAGAKGVVVYVPGGDGDADASPTDAIVPFYLGTAADQGWDVLKASVSTAAFTGDMSERGAAVLNGKLRELRDAGYRRVVVAGQSVGAWLAIRAANDPDFAGDAVIAAAPANFGPRVLWADGPENPFFEKNKTELMPLLEGANGRLALIFFDDDRFEPAGRAAEARRTLARAGVPNLVIDRPDAFPSHGAARLAAFDFAYGACIRDFAGAEVGAQVGAAAPVCEPPAKDPADHRWMTRRDHLAGSPARRLTTADLAGLVGDTLVGFLETGELATYFLAGGNRTLERIGSGRQQSSDAALATDHGGNLWCFTERGECYELYRWSEGLVIAVTPEGDIAFRGRLLSGNPRGLTGGPPAVSDTAGS